jgi:SAM-dependent methyltransferase
MFDDFLYNNPELYEKVFPSRGKSGLCIEVFQKYLPDPPSSVLDIACGSGRDLVEFAKRYPDCVGFDITPSMVALAQKRNPKLNIVTADMRSCRLNRSFDAICALGGSINFALSNDEMDATIKTYHAHAHEGTLLIVQPLNPGDFFGQLKVPEVFSISYDGFNVTGTASYKLSNKEQLVERTRIWKVKDENREFTDSMSFRVIFPAEMSYFLSKNGFDVLDIFETSGGPHYNTSMYVVARFKKQ